MSDHSIISPSNFSRLKQCAGYLKKKRQPRDNTESAIEGTKAHEAWEYYLKTRALPDNHDLDDEMIDIVVVAAEYVSSLMVNNSCKLYTEFKLDLSIVHELCFGTADAIVVDVENQIIHVIDLKTGRTVVEAYENWQLILYALGIKNVRFYNFKLHIVQPRVFSKPDVWEVSAEKLHDEYLIIAQQAALAAMDENNHTLKTGDCCKYCDVVDCPALRTSSFNAIGVAYDREIKMSELTPASMGVELAMIDDAMKLLKLRRDALEPVVEATIKEKDVPGWVMANKRTNRKWKDDYDASAIGEEYGVNLLSDPKPLPITKVEALKVKGLNVDDYTVKPTGAKVLKRTKDYINEVFMRN